MEELIVDDIPIFTRVHKKCLLVCSISVLQKYAKGLCLVNWFAAILKISKMRSVAMQTKCKPNQPVVVLVELLFIYMIYVRWLKWWCGWECACLSGQKFSNIRGVLFCFLFGVSLSLVQLVNIQAFHHLNFA